MVSISPNVVTTCSGTVTAAAGASSVSLSAGTLAVSSFCTISLDGTGTSASVKNNSVTSTSTEAGTGNTSTAAVTVIAPPTPADFSITAAVTTATVNKGSKVDYTFTLTPLNNVPFATSITLAVSGVPVGTTFYFQPASVTPGANPATSTLLLFTSTADTALAANINRRTAPLFTLGLAFGMPLAGMVMAGLRRKNDGLNLKSPGTAILLFVLMGVACYGCASLVGNRNRGTPSGIYNLTVTATGGTVQHSVPLTLTVRP